MKRSNEHIVTSPNGEYIDKNPTKDLTTLKQLYEKRIASLYEQIGKIYEKVCKDEIIEAMKGNKTSSEYIDKRIKEIILQNTTSERELFIEELIEELSSTKDEITALKESIKCMENDIRTKAIVKSKEVCNTAILQEEIAILNKKLIEERNDKEKLINEVKFDAKDTRIKHDKECEVLKNEIKTLNRKLEESYQEIISSRKGKNNMKLQESEFKHQIRTLEENNKALFNEYNNSKNMAKKNEELLIIKYNDQLNLEKLAIDENYKKIIKEKDDIIYKLNNKGQQIKALYEKKLQEVSLENNNEKCIIQTEIKKLNDVITNLNHEIAYNESTIKDLKHSHEVTISEFTKNISKLHEEHENENCNKEMELQHRIAEEQSKNANEIERLNEGFKAELEKKIFEVRAEGQKNLEKEKEAAMEMKAMIEDKITKEFVSLRIHIETIEEERKKGRELLKNEIAKLNSEHEKELLMKITNIEADKNKEIKGHYLTGSEARTTCWVLFGRK